MAKELTFEEARQALVDYGKRVSWAGGGEPEIADDFGNDDD